MSWPCAVCGKLMKTESSSRGHCKVWRTTKRLKSSDRASLTAFGPILNAAVNSASISFTILGTPVSMKNRRQIAKNRTTGKSFVRKSDDALRYSDDFLLQVPQTARKSIGGPKTLLRAIVSVWYPNWKSDVDVELIYDLLQKAGVVSNDRWIREKIVYGAHIDAKNPRVEITIEEI